jgi:hypothetical protein
MPLPRRKTDIQIYKGKELTDRRQEMLNMITKENTYLPEPILHDDLDRGMLDFINNNFKIVSDGKTIPVIQKILTIQRWAEVLNNWEFADDDNNMKVPFIGIIRRPDVQPGTNPSITRTIPQRLPVHYATVATWNGTQMGADVYKIPQPVAIDISFDVTIVCSKIRELNKLNKTVMQIFSSRQAYTTVKGHYIPIVLEKVEDNSPIDQIDGRRFYLQNYSFTMLGFLIDEEEFEVKPAVSRFMLLTEFIKSNNYAKKFINKLINIVVATFRADGMQTSFSVGESIAILFNVEINGLIQERDVDYYHIVGTSKITFDTAPYQGSVITIKYYAGKSSVLIDNYGKQLQVATENFYYSDSLIFPTINGINSVVSVDVNGIAQEENVGFEIHTATSIKLLATPLVGWKVGITYLY